MVALKNILVATDFSGPSDSALAYGRELARRFGASLTVLHVVEDLLVHAYGPDGVFLADSGMQQQLEVAAQRRVDALLFDEDRRELHARGRIVTSSVSAPAIIDFARQGLMDLIVMGTHGRGAVAHLFMGSVAERVVRNAPCPVLTVRDPEREFVRPDALVAVAKG
jgi:nucleotide-binding universal stress UspA family protein